ncbi:MAG: hypothetical protein GEU97_21750 [Actinophytocola sp.]|nr:hypothetical protein [Actinophytocola sp.]
MVATITRHQQHSDSGVDAYASTRISTPMVDALEQAWADIRDRHPELPPAVIVLGAGSIGSRSGELTLGHFAAMRWHTDTDGSEQLAALRVPVRPPHPRRHQCPRSRTHHLAGRPPEKRIHSGLDYKVPLEIHNEYLNRQLAA